MMTAAEIIAWLSTLAPTTRVFIDGEGLQLVAHGLEETWCEVGGRPNTAPLKHPTQSIAVPTLTADQRYEKEKKLEAICAEFGLEHATSCYEQAVGNRDGDTFWVCRPGCATARAHGILKRREAKAVENAAADKARTAWAVRS